MRHSSFVAASLFAGVSFLALAAGLSEARAQTNIGSVNIDTVRAPKPHRVAKKPVHPVHATRRAPAPAHRVAHVVHAPAAPAAPAVNIASDAAIGNNAPTGSAPALSTAQQSLNASQPASVVSRKIIEDVVPAAGDYNETAKLTPNFLSNNPNGALGDSKGAWRGFQDGQFNITFDGIPFGDMNDPTHHSAAYFPSAFLGQVNIDRGPGAASQAGYATFGGTMGLHSLALSDTFGGSVGASFGTWNTSTEFVTVQSGYNKEYQTRALFQYEHAFTDGQYDYGHYNQNNFLAKIEKQFGDVTATFFATYGTEEYINVGAPTWSQWQTYGKDYGAINNNPKSVLYYGYNNSEKQTDMEYIDLKGEFYGFKVDNKVYTYSYWYPNLQNNGISTSIEGNASTANGGTITTVKIPNSTGTSTKVNLVGITNGDVIGYLKDNNYRVWGDTLDIKHDLGKDWYKGELRFGLWVEHGDNGRVQEYYDYTKGETFTQLGNGLQESFKLNLESHITNVQPYVEYEWKPTDKLSITPGYKFESFTREHDAAVNQTTLAPLYFTTTYSTNLPFLTVRYKVSDELTVYGQASQGYLAPTVSAYYVFNPLQNNIQAQQTTNYQIGAVYKTQDITADFALYQQRATNFPIVTTLTNGLQIYQNGGTAQYRGAEFQGTWAFGRKINLEGLALTGAYGLSNAHYTQGQFTGLAVGDAPSFTLAAGLIYDDKRFFGSLIQRFYGEYWGSNGEKQQTATTNSQLNKIPGWNSTDFVLGYRYKLPEGFASGYGKQIEFKLGVQNIFDHRAITEITGDPTGNASINNTTLTYQFQQGRYIYGQIKYDF